MRLFDFFKKKDKTKTTTIDNREKHTPTISNLNQAVETTELSNNSHKTDNSIITPPKQTDTSSLKAIELLSVTDRDHTGNILGLVGTKTVQKNKEGTILNPVVNNALKNNQPLNENPTYIVYDGDFDIIGGNNSQIKTRIIVKVNDAKRGYFVFDVFPYMQTHRIIPFNTKRIYKWKEFSKIEAEIEGNGRDTFGFSFFATDYSFNKKTYIEQQSLNVKISAIALIIDKSNITKIGETPLSPDFAAYTQNDDFPSKSYNDFIGVLLDFEKVSLSKNISGYLLTLKLINHEEEDFFTVDTFVNEQNMRIKKLQKGMKLTGLLWFQGEIA